MRHAEAYAFGVEKIHDDTHHRYLGCRRDNGANRNTKRLLGYRNLCWKEFNPAETIHHAWEYQTNGTGTEIHTGPW